MQNANMQNANNQNGEMQIKKSDSFKKRNNRPWLKTAVIFYRAVGGEPLIAEAPLCLYYK